jgi:hypothetical protein
MDSHPKFKVSHISLFVVLGLPSEALAKEGSWLGLRDLCELLFSFREEFTERREGREGK